MNLLPISLALSAALIHACWSLVSKRLSRYDPTAFVWLASLGSLLAYAPIVILLTGSSAFQPSGMQAVFMAGSILINLGYFVITQYGYRDGDLSSVYPIARGTGPILATLGGMLLFGELPSVLGVAGLLAVATGVMAIGLLGRSADRHGVARIGPPFGFTYALLSGVAIAGYTLWDQHAVGALAVPPLLLNAVDDASRVVLLGPVVFRSWHGVRKLWSECRLLIVASGTLMPLPYLLFLYALRLAPANVVSPVREVSVVLVVLAGGRFLAEGQMRFKLLASAAVLCGLVTLTVGA
ncbi:DMT family transporter [Dactylosporangium sp. NPDC051484]|uniref:DMT family transporter n=1 Tax=Dactylosporangium sp. NPDC051484 TaxID=3154942 RepID=UPI00344C56FC